MPRRQATRALAPPAFVHVALLSALLAVTRATNPIVTHRYGADPSAHVWPTDPDTLYVYASHDPDNAQSHDEMIGAKQIFAQH